MGANNFAKEKKARSKRQRRTPPQAQQQTQASEDLFAKQKALCCHCNESFNVGALGGGFFSRKCPLCKMPLSEDIYDKAARIAKAKCREEARLFEEIQQTERELKEKLAKSQRWWQFFSRRRIERRLEELAPVIEERRVSAKAAETRFKNLAKARYYCGEWYLATHIQLSCNTGSAEDNYCLTVSYDGPNNTFSIDHHHANQKARGIAGEFMAFEAFRKEIASPEGRLHGARLMPNLYIPNYGRDGSKSQWTQVDLVLATRSCAFVIETKKRYSDIKTSAPFEEIKANEPGYQGEGQELTSYNAPLGQNSKHAVRFMSICSRYGFARIYELTLFVAPRSFETDCDEFCDNVLVSAIPDREQELMDTVAAVVGEHDEIMSQVELNMTAVEIIQKYGDFDQQKAKMHEKWLRR